MTVSTHDSRPARCANVAILATFAFSTDAALDFEPLASKACILAFIVFSRSANKNTR